MNQQKWREETDQSEARLVLMIRKHLLTVRHIMIMSANDWSIEDLLNGRFRLDRALEAQVIFRDWNATLGWEEFKL